MQVVVRDILVFIATERCLRRRAKLFLDNPNVRPERAAELAILEAEEAVKWLFLSFFFNKPFKKRECLEGGPMKRLRVFYQTAVVLASERSVVEEAYKSRLSFPFGPVISLTRKRRSPG